MTLPDVLCILCLMIFSQILGNYYIRGNQFSAEFPFIVRAGIILWLLFVPVSEDFSKLVLGVRPQDAITHTIFSEELIGYMNRGRWDLVWDFFGMGNKAYQTLTAIIKYSTGTSRITIIAINATLAFWGGLILARQLSDGFHFLDRREGKYLLIIFFPSVIFWGTSDLKEGVMYWSICNIASCVFGNRIVVTPLIVASVFLGGLFRPHIMLTWVFAVSVARLSRRGARAGALALLFVIPLLFYGVHLQTGIEYTPDSAFKAARGQWAILDKSGGGSHIETNPEGPLFFASGFISIFFRPFPWELKSLRFAAGMFETWALTLLLLFTWVGMSRPFFRLMIKLPEIRAAAITILIFCVFLSYLPNQGLVMRQRVQLVPALLTFVFRPRILKERFLYAKKLKFTPRTGVNAAYAKPDARNLT